MSYRLVLGTGLEIEVRGEAKPKRPIYYRIISEQGAVDPTMEEYLPRTLRRLISRDVVRLRLGRTTFELLQWIGSPLPIEIVCDESLRPLDACADFGTPRDIGDARFAINEHVN